MSCDAAALALTLHLAALRADAGADAPRLLRIASAPQPRATIPLLREPLFASIVQGATRLKAEVDGLRRSAALPAAALDAEVARLSELDMQGHVVLAQRGTDTDLKCILRGISQDLPRKLASVRSASGPAGRKSALDELWYLLRDNVEVVTTPASSQSTDTAT